MTIVLSRGVRARELIELFAHAQTIQKIRARELFKKNKTNFVPMPQSEGEIIEQKV
jgi:hypothetical protein